jgi:hypothetical protein
MNATPMKKANIREQDRSQSKREKDNETNSGQFMQSKQCDIAEATPAPYFRSFVLVMYHVVSVCNCNNAHSFFAHSFSSASAYQ